MFRLKPQTEPTRGGYNTYIVPRSGRVEVQAR